MSFKSAKAIERAERLQDLSITVQQRFKLLTSVQTDNSFAAADVTYLFASERRLILQLYQDTIRMWNFSPSGKVKPQPMEEVRSAAWVLKELIQNSRRMIAEQGWEVPTFAEEVHAYVHADAEAEVRLIGFELVLVLVGAFLPGVAFTVPSATESVKRVDANLVQLLMSAVDWVSIGVAAGIDSQSAGRSSGGHGAVDIDGGSGEQYMFTPPTWMEPTRKWRHQFLPSRPAGSPAQDAAQIRQREQTALAMLGLLYDHIGALVARSWERARGWWGLLLTNVVSLMFPAASQCLPKNAQESSQGVVGFVLATPPQLQRQFLAFLTRSLLAKSGGKVCQPSLSRQASTTSDPDTTVAVPSGIIPFCCTKEDVEVITNVVMLHVLATPDPVEFQTLYDVVRLIRHWVHSRPFPDCDLASISCLGMVLSPLFVCNFSQSLPRDAVDGYSAVVESAAATLNDLALCEEYDDNARLDAFRLQLSGITRIGVGYSKTCRSHGAPVSGVVVGPEGGGGSTTQRLNDSASAVVASEFLTLVAPHLSEICWRTYFAMRAMVGESVGSCGGEGNPACTLSVSRIDEVFFSALDQSIDHLCQAPRQQVSPSLAPAALHKDPTVSEGLDAAVADSPSGTASAVVGTHAGGMSLVFTPTAYDSDDTYIPHYAMLHHEEALCCLATRLLPSASAQVASALTKHELDRISAARAKKRLRQHGFRDVPGVRRRASTTSPTPTSTESSDPGATLLRMHRATEAGALLNLVEVWEECDGHMFIPSGSKCGATATSYLASLFHTLVERLTPSESVLHGASTSKLALNAVRQQAHGLCRSLSALLQTTIGSESDISKASTPPEFVYRLFVPRFAKIMEQLDLVKSGVRSCLGFVACSAVDLVSRPNVAARHCGAVVSAIRTTLVEFNETVGKRAPTITASHPWSTDSVSASPKLSPHAAETGEVLPSLPQDVVRSIFCFVAFLHELLVRNQLILGRVFNRESPLLEPATESCLSVLSSSLLGALIIKSRHAQLQLLQRVLSLTQSLGTLQRLVVGLQALATSSSFVNDTTFCSRVIETVALTVCAARRISTDQPEDAQREAENGGQSTDESYAGVVRKAVETMLLEIHEVDDDIFRSVAKCLHLVASTAALEGSFAITAVCTSLLLRLVDRATATSASATADHQIGVLLLLLQHLALSVHEVTPLHTVNAFQCASTTLLAVVLDVFSLVATNKCQNKYQIMAEDLASAQGQSFPVLLSVVNDAVIAVEVGLVVDREIAWSDAAQPLSPTLCATALNAIQRLLLAGGPWTELQSVRDRLVEQANTPEVLAAAWHLRHTDTLLTMTTADADTKAMTVTAITPVGAQEWNVTIDMGPPKSMDAPTDGALPASSLAMRLAIDALQPEIDSVGTSDPQQHECSESGPAEGVEGHPHAGGAATRRLRGLLQPLAAVISSGGGFTSPFENTAAWDAMAGPSDACKARIDAARAFDNSAASEQLLAPYRVMSDGSIAHKTAPLALSEALGLLGGSSLQRSRPCTGAVGVPPTVSLLNLENLSDVLHRLPVDTIQPAASIEVLVCADSIGPGMVASVSDRLAVAVCGAQPFHNVPYRMNVVPFSLSADLGQATQPTDGAGGHVEPLATVVVCSSVTELVSLCQRYTVLHRRVSDALQGGQGGCVHAIIISVESRVPTYTCLPVHGHGVAAGKQQGSATHPRTASTTLAELPTIRTLLRNGCSVGATIASSPHSASDVVVSGIMTELFSVATSSGVAAANAGPIYDAAALGGHPAAWRAALEEEHKKSPHWYYPQKHADWICAVLSS